MERKHSTKPNNPQQLRYNSRKMTIKPSLKYTVVRNHVGKNQLLEQLLVHPDRDEQQESDYYEEYDQILGRDETSLSRA